jgi:hypothetical protein
LTTNYPSSNSKTFLSALRLSMKFPSFEQSITFIAYKSLVFFFETSQTAPNAPVPKTRRNSKSLIPKLSLINNK